MSQGCLKMYIKFGANFQFDLGGVVRPWGSKVKVTIAIKCFKADTFFRNVYLDTKVNSFDFWGKGPGFKVTVTTLMPHSCEYDMSRMSWYDFLLGLKIPNDQCHRDNDFSNIIWQSLGSDRATSSWRDTRRGKNDGDFISPTSTASHDSPVTFL